MKTITTEAYVLYQGGGGAKSGPEAWADLHLEEFSFPDITEYEVLAEPVYGCWEGNMDHALKRRPVDICRQRGEQKVVIGNAGVVRILKTGKKVTAVKEGDHCFVFPNGVWDARGFPKKVHAYDAPHTIGVLAKMTKMHERVVTPIPKNSYFSLKQWAGFSIRHVTAWANWKAAYGCFRTVLSADEYPHPFVWGWGGGTTFAELELARHYGCETAMISSNDQRLNFIRQKGITAIDRRNFIHLSYDDEKYQTDPAYKNRYLESEEAFLRIVKDHTGGKGVSIFLDYLGLPVVRATLKALACPGVIATAGWKAGMNISSLRALECMNWHMHVHTHYARYNDGLEAAQFAEEKGWMPFVSDDIYSWDQVPQLAADYASGTISTYFPLFSINS